MARIDDGVGVSQSSGEFSRRRFLRVAGGVASGALTVPLLAACGAASPGSPTASPTRPAAALPTPTGAAAAKGIYPSYVPASTPGLKADFPASGPMYSDAFNGYPANPARAIADPPGTGGTVNIMSIQLFPP